MRTDEAIVAFSQSDKIKSGLLWAAQVLELLGSLHPPERGGGERIVSTLLGMISREIHLAKKLAPDPAWEEAEKFMEKGSIMIDSGASHEAGYHLTRALSHVTGIGQRAMTHLREKGHL
jgi:hypothetical protein